MSNENQSQLSKFMKNDFLDYCGCLSPKVTEMIGQ